MTDQVNSSKEVRLPTHLCEAAEKLIQGTRFTSIDQFLTFILQELTSNQSAQSDAQERKAIEDRLRDLGYL